MRHRYSQPAETRAGGTDDGKRRRLFYSIHSCTLSLSLYVCMYSVDCMQIQGLRMRREEGGVKLFLYSCALHAGRYFIYGHFANTPNLSAVIRTHIGSN